MISCMGGWCTCRNRCARHLADDRRLPVERLCEPGKKDAYEPVVIVPRLKEAA